MTMQDAVFQYKCNTLARTYLTNECIFALKILLELFYCLERVNAKTARIISCLPSFVLKPAEVKLALHKILSDDEFLINFA